MVFSCKKEFVNVILAPLFLVLASKQQDVFRPFTTKMEFKFAWPVTLQYFLKIPSMANASVLREKPSMVNVQLSTKAV